MTQIRESDIAALAAKIEREIVPQGVVAEASADYGYNITVAVIDCVLSLN